MTGRWTEALRGQSRWTRKTRLPGVDAIRAPGGLLQGGGEEGVEGGEPVGDIGAGGPFPPCLLLRAFFGAESWVFVRGGSD